MTELSALWMPVVASAALVFVVSSILNTILPWHKGDYRQVPNEDQARDALRPLAIPPGDYVLPRASSMKDMGSPEYQKKLAEGPVLLMTVRPNGQMSMGASLIQWFIFCLVAGLFAAYVAGRALPPGAHYLAVFRFAGVTSFAAYSLALWPMSIWYGRSWSSTLKANIDGLIYGLLTAGTFGWLWPAA